MAKIKVAHDDTLTFFIKFPSIVSRTITAYGGLKVIEHSHPNELTSMIVGYNNSVAYQIVPGGKMVEISFQIMRASDDDEFITDILNDTKEDFVIFPFIDVVYKQKGRSETRVKDKIFKFTDGIIKNPTYYGTDGSAGSDTPLVKYNFMFLDTNKIVFEEDPNDTAREQQLFNKYQKYMK